MVKENLITKRVASARLGENKFVISKMDSGWLVIGDIQPLIGYCVFLADPVVSSINDLNELDRINYSIDVLRAGDALLEATGAERINYETLCNSEPALHTHLIPRYASERIEKRRMPAFMVYSWTDAPGFDQKIHGELVNSIRGSL